MQDCLREGWRSCRKKTSNGGVDMADEWRPLLEAMPCATPLWVKIASYYIVPILCPSIYHVPKVIECGCLCTDSWCHLCITSKSQLVCIAASYIAAQTRSTDSARFFFCECPLRDEL